MALIGVSPFCVLYAVVHLCAYKYVLCPDILAGMVKCGLCFGNTVLRTENVKYNGALLLFGRGVIVALPAV